MLFRSSPRSLKATDVRLHPFLRARTDTEAQLQLDVVFKEHVRPTCEAILKPRFAAPTEADSSAEQQEDLEDVSSTVIENMLQPLQAMRVEYQTTHAIVKPIQDIRRYTAMTTFNAWKGYLRKRKPVYHQVYRFVRSLLMNHKPKDNMPQMAAWEEVQSNSRKIQVGGLALWRDQKQPSVCDDRLLTLQQSPKLIMAEAWIQARKSARLEERDPLSHDGLHVIFTWVNHPITLNHLTQLLCEATDRIDAPTLPLEHGKDISDVMLDQGAVAFMQVFWECVCAEMTPRQRAVLLLGGEDPNGVSLLQWIFEEGIANHRKLAEMMEMPVMTLMKVWQGLPLNDKAIAEALGCTVQSVRDRRLDGRAKLARCLSEFL